MLDKTEDKFGGPLWVYACALYASPGVADDLIALQDEAGIDVNLVLFAAWLGNQRGIELTPERLAHSRQAVDGWQTDVVGPLRSVRRALRAKLATMPLADSLRTEVKASELLAERIELAALAQLSADWPDGKPSRRLGLENVAILLAPMQRQPGSAVRSALSG